MNTRMVKQLIALMENSSLTAMEIEEGDCKVRLERTARGECAPAVYAAPIVQPAVQPTAPVAAQTAAQPAEAEKKEEPVAGREQKSPMVGVFYAAPSPESEPYVKVGSRVKKGDVLCIIEAMKLMNEVTAEFDGEVAEICAQDGEVVEYGQTLFILR
ncbi:MAG TPA: acetyl-CoA carboxylase biotin carboxyl carrier protein [Candidatus Gallacutalibacter stercoravium]|nr:acetyl-CoA carboxylase biotin carboxyl carrier protein [Candidatus Gallacutalibacter stercoravium]